MATLTTVPTYPPPNRDTSVTITLQESGANYVKIWVTAAPPGSELRKKIDGTKDPRNRYEVYKGDGGVNSPWRFRFDKGGKYTFAIQEYTRGASTFGGGYQDDPDGAPSETKVGSEYTPSLHIGQRMTLPIAVGNDSLTLVFWIWAANIRATSIAVHGEESPALQNASPTARAQAAQESAAVISALAALVGGDDSAAFGTPSAIIGNGSGGLIKEYNDHRTQAGVHDANDSNNVVPAGLASAASAKNLADAVNELLRFIRQHYTNDIVEAGTDAGRDTAAYHDVSGKKNDNVNMPLFQGVSERDAYIALADIHRSLAAHFASTAVHDTADATNTLTALPTVLALASAIFAVWASPTPAVPATQSTLAMAAIAKAGAEETPL